MSITTVQLVRYQFIDQFFIYSMLLISLVPVIAISRTSFTPERIAFATSFGGKLAFMIIAAGVFRGDWNVGCIGAFILIVGDAGMLILSLLERRT